MSTPAPNVGPPPRYPVQDLLDGDFTVAEILSITGHAITRTAPGPHRDLAAAALRAGLWRLDHVPRDAEPLLANTSGVPSSLHNAASGDDVALLHAFETSPLWRPPVSSATATLTPTIAAAWLALATHWIGVSATTSDLRFLNTACKLLGAVWIHYHAAADAAQRKEWRTLASPLAAVAHLVGEATNQLAGRLATRLVVADPPTPHSDPGGLTTPTTRTGPSPTTIALAGAGSTGAIRFLTAAVSHRLPIAAVCWFGTANTSPVGAPSGYADAWYPPEHPTSTTLDAPALPACLPQITAPTWDAVATTLRRYHADLVVLLGMPIVPAPILDLARLGFVNAHNGALPYYRGMDAVAWALLNNDAVVCTLHLARPAVDSGEVLATAPVPFSPAGTLRPRVKAAQLGMLLAVTGFVTATGRLPDATRQPPLAGRQYYRLHPHLKRVLDTSAHGVSPRPALVYTGGPT